MPLPLACTVAAFVPCSLLCFAASGEQLAGIDQSVMSYDILTDRIMVVVQAEKDICTDKLLAPPEPAGAVVLGDDDIDPATERLVGQVQLPVPKPPRFEPAIERWREVIAEEWGRQQIPAPPGEEDGG
jgi:hypothetical protein